MAVLTILALSACTTLDAQGNEVDSTGSVIMTVGMLVVMVAVFYFMIIRPQKKQEKETAKMLDALTPGDTISTVGGIIGVVLKVKDDMVLIETGADRTRIQIAKWAVRKVEEKAND
ncbi:MAG: preprotein translocase subunit YajC [Ruminococcaceae bacterium]|nr:preprotein translocase subunit YajC [Oscillospiraceae bacterium]MBQ3597788.1 preprotein translocase subunit YajC [Clostridia bacterium]MBR2915507.1 preprotein translocase subunit YajC [Clostridia bacterium]